MRNADFGMRNEECGMIKNAEFYPAPELVLYPTWYRMVRERISECGMIKKCGINPEKFDKIVKFIRCLSVARDCFPRPSRGAGSQ
jgi:hypothetical protein